jgi:hypothetical protein
MITEEQLKIIAARFGQHVNQNETLEKQWRPFDDDSWIDPLTSWSLERIGNNRIEWVILLLDWVPEGQASKPPGTVEYNVRYCEHHYTKAGLLPSERYDPVENRDPTLAHLFWSCWSHQLLETRRCLVGNAIWGARKPHPRLKEIEELKGEALKEENTRRAKELTKEMANLSSWVDPSLILPPAERIIWKEILRMIEPKPTIFACGPLGKYPGGFCNPTHLICHPSYRMWPVQRAGLEAADLIILG